MSCAYWGGATYAIWEVLYIMYMGLAGQGSTLTVQGSNLDDWRL